MKQLKITELISQHDRKSFDCGNEALNNFIQRTAKQQAGREITRTYVLCETDNPSKIIGFYTLTFCSVKPHPDCLAPKYPHDLSAIKIARFAVDAKQQGKGIGGYLLMDALRKSLDVHKISPLMGVTLDAKDQSATKFYSSHGFSEFESKPEGIPTPMILLMQTIQEALEPPT